MNNVFTDFFAGHPFIAFLLSIPIIFLIIKIVRITFRLVLIAALTGLIFAVIFGYSPNDLFKQSAKIASFSTSFVQNTIHQMIDNSLKNTHLLKGANGTYEIVGDQFEIGENPQGKFIINLKSLHLSLPQDELSK